MGVALWNGIGPKETLFERVKDVNNGREYVRVEKPKAGVRMHIPLEDFEYAARELLAAAPLPGEGGGG